MTLPEVFGKLRSSVTFETNGVEGAQVSVYISSDDRPDNIPALKRSPTYDFTTSDRGRTYEILGRDGCRVMAS